MHYLNEQQEPREIVLQEALASGNLDLAQAGLKELHPSEIADLLESLPPRERDMLWELVQPEQVGEVLAHVQDAVRAALLEPMAPGEVASLTERLDTDDAADILQDLPEDRVEEVLRSMDEQHRQRLASILSYPEDTAGGLMNTDTVTVRCEVPDRGGSPQHVPRDAATHYRINGGSRCHRR
jgi:magnesium transporter